MRRSAILVDLFVLSIGLVGCELVTDFKKEESAAVGGKTSKAGGAGGAAGAKTGSSLGGSGGKTGSGGGGVATASGGDSQGGTDGNTTPAGGSTSTGSEGGSPSSGGTATSSGGMASAGGSGAANGGASGALGIGGQGGTKIAAGGTGGVTAGGSVSGGASGKVNGGTGGQGTGGQGTGGQGQGTGGQGTGGTTNAPPTLVSTDPGDGAVGVVRKASIRLTFSEPIDPASIHATLQLGGATVAASTAVTGAVVTVQPSVPFALLGSYQLVVKGTLADLAGAQLGSDVSVKFTVQGGTLAAAKRLDTQDAVEVGAPEIRDDGTGTLTIVWDDSSGQNIWWNRRDRQTLAWGTAGALSTGTTLTCPTLAFDGTGRGVVMWTRGTNELVAQRVATDGSRLTPISKDFGVDMTTPCNSVPSVTTERYFAMVGDVALLADNAGQPPASVEFGWVTGWGDRISAGCRSMVVKLLRSMTALGTGAFVSSWDGYQPGATIPSEAWVCSYLPSSGWSLQRTLATFNTGTTYYGNSLLGAGADDQILFASDSQKKLWWNRTSAGAWQTNADLNASQVGLRAFAVGSGGHAIVAWDNGSALYAQAYDPTSHTWTSAAQLSAVTTSAYAVWAGVDARGNGLVGWLDNAASSASGCLELSRYTVQSGWTAQQSVPGSYGKECSDLTGAATSQGDMVLAWRQASTYGTLKELHVVAFE